MRGLRENGSIEEDEVPHRDLFARTGMRENFHLLDVDRQNFRLGIFARWLDRQEVDVVAGGTDPGRDASDGAAQLRPLVQIEEFDAALADDENFVVDYAADVEIVGAPRGFPKGFIRRWRGSWSRARPSKTRSSARCSRRRGSIATRCAIWPASPGRFPRR